MKRNYCLLFIALMLAGTMSGRNSLDLIIEGLRNINGYAADARFVVMMPQQPNDVIYDLTLNSDARKDDPWAPCDYLISWTLEGATTQQNGFAAYFDGHHYRFRGSRLQEYHLGWDSIPFAPRGNAAEGVQCRAQFANLLPAFIAQELTALAATPGVKVMASADTIVSGEKAALVRTERYNDGMLVQRGYYRFDPTTFYPVKVETENNIGALSEQTVSVNYSSPGANAVKMTQWTEEELMALYPTEFEKFRENNYRVENLPGVRLPQFSLECLDGSRYTRAGDDTFDRPVLLAVIDPSTGYNNELVSAVREAVTQLPADVDIFYAFLGNNKEQIAGIVGAEQHGERVLTSAHSLARHLGIADCPVVLLVGSDGKIADVILGFNNELATDVIQKMALVR